MMATNSDEDKERLALNPIEDPEILTEMVEKYLKSIKDIHFINDHFDEPANKEGGNIQTLDFNETRLKNISDNDETDACNDTIELFDIDDEEEKDFEYNFRATLSQFTVTLLLNFLNLNYGMVVAMPTLLVGTLDHVTALNETRISAPQLILDDQQSSWLGSVLMLFHPLGAVTSGYLQELIGRKSIMFTINIPFLISWLLLHSAQHVYDLYIASLIMGFSLGCCEAPVASYIGEISQPKLRGAISLLTGCASSIGSLVVFILYTYTNWRVTFLLSSLVPSISLLLLGFLPESPVYLISKNQHSEAKKSLMWLRGWISEDPKHSETMKKIENELKQIKSITNQCNILYINTNIKKSLIDDIELKQTNSDENSKHKLLSYSQIQRYNEPSIEIIEERYKKQCSENGENKRKSRLHKDNIHNQATKYQKLEKSSQLNQIHGNINKLPPDKTEKIPNQNETEQLEENENIPNELLKFLNTKRKSTIRRTPNDQTDLHGIDLTITNDDLIKFINDGKNQRVAKHNILFSDIENERMLKENDEIFRNRMAYKIKRNNKYAKRSSYDDETKLKYTQILEANKNNYETIKKGFNEHKIHSQKERLERYSNTFNSISSSNQYNGTIELDSKNTVRFETQNDNLRLGNRNASNCQTQNGIVREMLESRNASSVTLSNDTSNSLISSSDQSYVIIKTSHPKTIKNLIKYTLKNDEIGQPLKMVLIIVTITTVASLTPIRPFLMEIIQSYDTGIDSDFVLIGTSILNILGFLVCALTIHKLGKRRLSILALSLNAIVSVLLGYYASSQSSHNSCVPIYCIYLNSFLQGYGILQLPWILMSEVFSLEIRGVACGICAGFSYLLNFILTKSYLSMTNLIGLEFTIYSYTMVGILGIIYIYNYLPETENKTCKQIQKHFQNKMKK